ncbi:MAG: glycosyltransferase, partial [Bryobacterales bacterium]|nr:glycosyltransferase [Bryobacterales bacterium]
MKILYFAPHPVWPLTTGARLRDYHCARQLALRGEVTFVQMCNPGEAPPEAPAEAGFVRLCTVYKDRSYTPGKILRGLLGPAPIPVVNYTSVSAFAELRRILESHGPFDSIQVEGVFLSAYVPEIRRLSDAAIVSDWHNIESELMRRYAGTEGNPIRKLAALRTAPLLQRVEEGLIKSCDAVAVVSEREQRILLGRYPGVRIVVIPNGVDTAFYRRGAGEEEGERRSLLFVGSMDYHANIDAVQWFAAEIWPGIAEQNPGLRFTVVGKDPPASIRALHGGSVEVTGTVPDVRPYYRQAVALAVPLRVGSGTRLKVLEAMAARVPVISTRCGAEGIDAQHDRELLYAETREEFCLAVAKLCTESGSRARLTAAAEDLVGRNYEWSAIGEKLFEVHRHAAETA